MESASTLRAIGALIVPSSSITLIYLYCLLYLKYDKVGHLEKLMHIKQVLLYMGQIMEMI